MEIPARTACLPARPGLSSTTRQCTTTVHSENRLMVKETKNSAPEALDRDVGLLDDRDAHQQGFEQAIDRARSRSESRPELTTSTRREIVSHHLPVLHHESNTLELADVGDGISGNSDEVGELAGLDRA